MGRARAVCVWDQGGRHAADALGQGHSGQGACTLPRSAVGDALPRTMMASDRVVCARATQGLDTVLEGHGVLPPASPRHGKEAAERRRSRELLEQQETAQLMFEKKREADLAMLEKLRGAGATADTLRYVETAIRRRAEAGTYMDFCCASAELHPLTAAPRPRLCTPHCRGDAVGAKQCVCNRRCARSGCVGPEREASSRRVRSSRRITSWRHLMPWGHIIPWRDFQPWRLSRGRVLW